MRGNNDAGREAAASTGREAEGSLGTDRHALSSYVTSSPTEASRNEGRPGRDHAAELSGKSEHRQAHAMDRDLPGAVVVSTEIVNGTREDTVGPLAVGILEQSRVHTKTPQHVAEDPLELRAALRDAIASGARIIVTVGGTGVGPGDITPEVSAEFISVRMDGLTQQIRDVGLAKTPLSSLSRGIVGITERGVYGVLIVNSPGSRGGVKDALGVICPLLPHIFEQLDDQDHS
ncbi:molybdopterin-binding protein [Actinobaculum sp. 352]|uniref:molybdopterin-binding protein n=2 Tax=unclassified Actinobaculum TaxID=2609299 RepID=UPI001F498E3D|nr:molybdopterin-binding protein [Actinobaculum sp. 352]